MMVSRSSEIAGTAIMQQAKGGSVILLSNEGPSLCLCGLFAEFQDNICFTTFFSNISSQ